jgi:predicted GNAT family acetyltransferase
MITDGPARPTSDSTASMGGRVVGASEHTDSGRHRWKIAVRRRSRRARAGLCHHLSMAETGDAAESYQHDPARRRFRLSIGGTEAVVLDYVDRPGAWDVVHTYADPAFRGTGAASRLVRHVFEEARAAGLGIVPSCPYIPVWVDRHPDAADLVVGRR